MRALVTGGAGFIGSTLVDALLDRGDDVVVVDNLSCGKRENLADGVRLEVADIRDGDRMRDLVAEVAPDVVFHLAAQIDVRLSLEDPVLDAQTNVAATAGLLEAARLAGVQRFVFASTGGAIYGETDVVPTPERVEALPMAAYGQSKFCAERYLGLYERLYGMSTVGLRFGNVYGPRQDPHGEAGVIAIFCGRLRSGERPVVFGTGRQTRDYIFVDDIVGGMVAAAGRRDVCGTLNLGTSEETSVLDLIAHLRQISGAQDWEPELRPARTGEIERSCLDPSAAREQLGWTARVGIAEGLRRTYAAVVG